MAWGTKTVASWSRRTPTQRPPSYPEPYTHPKPVYRNPVKCRIYLIYVWDPRTNYRTITLGYVGETMLGRETTRFLEHVGDGTARKPGQPWSDTIPEHDPARAAAEGHWVVLDAVYDSKEDVWVAEEATVVKLRPLYNDEYNRHNRDRIKIPKARRQRADRDRAAGVPPEKSWGVLHAEYEARRAATGGAQAETASSWWPVSLRTHLSPIARRRLGHAIKWGSLWAGPTLPLWWLAARYAHVVSTARLGAVTGLLVALVLLSLTRPSRRAAWWRRTRHALLRTAGTLLMLYLLIWPWLDQLFRYHPRR